MKLINPVRKMEAFLAKNPSLKESAQRAFVSYAKAVFLMKDKEIFDVNALDTNNYATSLGLAIPPRIRFLQRMQKGQLGQKIAPKQSGNNGKHYFDTHSDEEQGVNIKIESGDSRVNKKYFDTSINEEQKIKEELEDSGVTEEDCNQSNQPFQVTQDDSDDDILHLKRSDHDIELPTDKELADLHMGRNKNKKPVTKAAVAKKILKKKIVANKKIMFDEEGDAVISGMKSKKSDLALEYENSTEGGIDIEKAKRVLKEEDQFDKQLFKEKVKAKHKEKKRKLKEKKKKEQLEKDDFGESDSDQEVDLSWLPDPDNVYGKKTDDENDNMVGGSGDEYNADAPKDQVVKRKK